MSRLAFLSAGLLSMALAALGAFLPLLPSVPFIILAAWCFARSSPKLEHWLVGHPRFGPHITAWRAKGAISRAGKSAAMLAFTVSVIAGFALLPMPWSLAPLAPALAGGGWILSRPSA